jgi:DNA polymerase-1
MAKKSRKSFYIIDGHAHIYRAYFAPFRDLTSPTGEPTKATYVFTQMLLQLAEQRGPDYLLMVTDSGDEQVFRKAIDPNYKANREAPPDDFKPQEERILQLVKDAGVPMLSAEGFEADDLIATIVRRYAGLYDFHLVSKDKDLRQLLGDGVAMYDVQKDEDFDADAMEAKLGYRPEQAVDVQALMGDNVDNVPGVPGIGEKTAAKLVNKFGTAEAVVENADKLTPKQSQNVREHGLEKLAVSKTLVTLRDDVPIDGFDPGECEFKGLDTPALRDHLDELGFRSLLGRLGGGDALKSDADVPDKPPAKYQPLVGGLFSETESADDDCDYVNVDTPEKLADFVAKLVKQARFAFDTETDGLGAMSSDLIGMSFSWADNCGYYLPIKGPMGAKVLEDAALDAVRGVLEDASVGKIGHNLKYDQMVMANAGVTLRGATADTVLMAFLLDAGRNSYKMDDLSADLLGHATIPIKQLIGTGKKQITMDQVPVEEVARYAAEDADVTWRLFNVLDEKLEKFPQLRALHDEMELPLAGVLASMERNGVRVDPKILAEQSAVLLERIEGLRKRIADEGQGDFNPDSPKQLQEVLFERLKLKPIRKTKTGYSTDAATLEQLAADHPLPGLILEYRGLMKLRETYLENLSKEINPRTGRIHTSFNQTGASTGRLSSSDPNLQNIPIRTDEGRRIRLAFVPDEGNVLLTADYSQIELRFLAHFCGEERLIEAFADDQDIHRAVAADVYDTPLDAVTDEQRRYAKTINFAIIYGVSAFGLARRVEGLNQRSAKELIDNYKKQYPRVFDFFDQCIIDAKSRGFVETIRGRRRPIPEIESRIASMRQYAERTAINSVIQGSAADLIKLAMLEVDRRLRETNSPAKLLLQVHDELVFECPVHAAEATAALARDAMVNAMELRVPLKVDAGWAKNWGEAK